jgi:hypothetical protein
VCLITVVLAGDCAHSQVYMANNVCCMCSWFGCLFASHGYVHLLHCVLHHSAGVHVHHLIHLANALYLLLIGDVVEITMLAD